VVQHLTTWRIDVKTLIGSLCILLALCFVQTSHAQFFDKLKKKAEEKVVKEVEKGMEGKKEEEKKTAEMPPPAVPQEQGKAGGGSEGTEANRAITINSKYDFIPGEKVIFFDDFTAEAIGDFPVQWNTTGSGEVVTTDAAPGRWFHITNSRGITALDEPVTLSENYTIEFDVIPVPDAKNSNSTAFTFSIISTTKPKVLNYGLARPGEAGVRFSFQYTNAYFAYYNDNTPPLDGRENAPRLMANHPYRISVWVQKERVRLYVDQEKLFDSPRAMRKKYTFNMIRFDEGTPLVGNVRIATGLPDMRSKLITEGKLVSYGIFFDVNKDIVKAESYPTLKQIAGVLADNPGVRISIVGHTDSDGDDRANLDLSKRRALAVKDALVRDFQIDAGRIETVGKGESAPVAPNDSMTNKALNRRVEFVKL